MVTKLTRPGYTRISWRSLIFFSQFRCCTRNVPPSIWRAEPGLSTSIPLVSSDFLLYKMKRTCSDDSVEGASERIRKWTVKRMISTLAFFTDSSLLRTFSSYCTADRAHHVPEEHMIHHSHETLFHRFASVCLSIFFLPSPSPSPSPSLLPFLSFQLPISIRQHGITWRAGTCGACACACACACGCTCACACITWRASNSVLLPVNEVINPLSDPITSFSWSVVRSSVRPSICQFNSHMSTYCPCLKWFIANSIMEYLSVPYSDLSDLVDLTLPLLLRVSLSALKRFPTDAALTRLLARCVPWSCETQQGYKMTLSFPTVINGKILLSTYE